MSDWNPALEPWDPMQPSKRGGADSYETYETLRNLTWQTRAAPPTAYESTLADALMAAFDDGASDLAGVVVRLNAARVHAPDGSPWTEPALAAELERLGV